MMISYLGQGGLFDRQHFPGLAARFILAGSRLRAPRRRCSTGSGTGAAQRSRPGWGQLLPAGHTRQVSGQAADQDPAIHRQGLLTGGHPSIGADNSLRKPICVRVSLLDNRGHERTVRPSYRHANERVLIRPRPRASRTLVQMPAAAPSPVPTARPSGRLRATPSMRTGCSQGRDSNGFPCGAPRSARYSRDGSSRARLFCSTFRRGQRDRL